MLYEFMKKETKNIWVLIVFFAEKKIEAKKFEI